MATQTRQRALLIVNITSDVKIAVHLNCTVVLQLDEATGAMDEPELANWSKRGCLSARECPANNNTVFGIPFLRKNQDLIAW
jgi:hypothetical protein